MLDKVTNINNSIWINASAGCGKTTLLIKRLLSLLIQKQKNIVCITFTNAAASEMQNRLFKILVELNIKSEVEIISFLKENLNFHNKVDCLYIKNLLYKCDELVKINTFHSFCFEILKNTDLLYNDLLIDENIQSSTFNLIINDFIEKNCELPKKVSQILTENKLYEIFGCLINNYHKNYNELIKKINSQNKTSEQTRHILTTFNKIVNIYREKSKNYLTFNAIIDNFIQNQLWNDFKIASSIEHLLVDEAQDTNLKQWYIITKFCEEFFIHEDSHKTLFVVGDKKQSIYAFQGANPNALISFYEIIKSQDLKNKLLNLEIKKSYRSSPIILNFVDEVFNNAAIQIDDVEKITHEAHHLGYPGYVEIHPLVKSAEDKELILAQTICQTIKSWLDDNRIIPAKKRVIQPSDIAVLVAHRTKFINHLNQELHKYNIDVNFVGKIIVNDNKILKLLINIGKFFTYKYDEISLIAILKSPIFNLKDKDIFQIKIQDTKINLYEHLLNTEIGKILENWLNFHGTSFEIYTNILNYNILTKLRSFYGREFDYYLNIFLDNTLKENSIYKFLDQISKDGTKLKIEGGKGVNISTVHGSKGLEYPIVFLADTNYIPSSRNILLYNEDEIPFWYTDEKVDYFEKLKNYKAQETYHEYIRLLYVALTRAENEIYIFGSGERLKKKSWYEICEKTVKNIGKTKDNNIYYYSDKEDYFIFDEKLKEITNEIETPPNLNLPPKRITKKTNFELERGKLIHKILENIVYIDNKESWLNEFLKNYVFGFTEKIKNEIKHCILKFLENHQNLNGISEVEIVHNYKLYRIDLLNFKDNEITMIDYKTNKDKKLTKNIINQLEEYKKVLKIIYRKKIIKTKVIWI